MLTRTLIRNVRRTACGLGHNLSRFKRTSGSMSAHCQVERCPCVVTVHDEPRHGARVYGAAARVRCLPLLAVLLTLSACADNRREYEDGSWVRFASRAGEPCTSGCRPGGLCDRESLYIVRELRTDSVRMTRDRDAAPLTVHADSLSHSVRPGEVVQRCNRPVRGLAPRLVTWCRV